MEKTLLTAILFVFISVASAQQDELQNSLVCESFVAISPNQLTTAFGPKTNLWYDKDIDALSFVFVVDSLNVGYASSLDHGATWQVDTVLYHASSVAEKGRYPQGAIYNPAGNTNPSNAYVTCFGMTSDTGGYNGFYEGTSAIGSGAHQQTHYTHFTSPQSFIPQGGTIVKNTGDTWWSAAGRSGLVYNDTVVLAKGTFGGGNFSYNFIKLTVPVCTDNNGNKMYRNQGVTFDDSGQHGYVVVIGNNWACNAQDSSMGLIVLETFDGGNTWTSHSPYYLSWADQLLNNNGTIYSAANELDLAMDQSDGLHIGLPIVPFAPGNAIQYSYPSGTWGLFDLTINGPGYSMCRIAMPQTFYGQFGFGGGPILDEDNRFQLSRSWDGSKLFYTWFDTDTAVFGNIGNLYSDIHSIGLDVATSLYTNEINFTQFSGINGDGNSLFGNVSYYTFNDGTDENIPVIIDVMAVSTGDPVTFFSIGCTPIANYVNAGNCIVTDGISDPGDIHSILTECSVYPNPFSGKTFMEVSLAQSTAIRIEITNTLGELVSSHDYENLPGGKNILTIDGTRMNKGLYFYTVRAGTEAVTKMMSVE